MRRRPPATTMCGMKIRLCIALAVTATCAAAAPAGAVIGGEPLEHTDVPWFASVSGCGGTLVQSDRLLTAAHCVGGIAPGDMAPTVVDGQSRTVTHVAMHPRFRSPGCGFFVDIAASAGKRSQLFLQLCLQFMQPSVNVVDAIVVSVVVRRAFP